MYVIDNVLDTEPREYKLVSLNGEKIKGRFYQQELVKVTMNVGDTYQIEKILKQRVYKGVKKVYVRWKGWDKSHNQWVPASDLVDV